MKFWKSQFWLIRGAHICNTLLQFYFFVRFRIQPTQFRCTRGYGGGHAQCIMHMWKWIIYVLNSFEAARTRYFYFDIITCRSWDTLARHFDTYIPEMYFITAGTNSSIAISYTLAPTSNSTVIQLRDCSRSHTNTLQPPILRWVSSSTYIDFMCVCC